MSPACAICGEPVAEGHPTRTCSARCRVALWRQTRDRDHATVVAQLQEENQRLRRHVVALEQYVGELQHLVGNLKSRWRRR